MDGVSVQCAVYDATRAEHSPPSPAQRRVLVVAHDLPDRWVEIPPVRFPRTSGSLVGWAGLGWVFCGRGGRCISPHRGLVAVTV